MLKSDAAILKDKIKRYNDSIGYEKDFLCTACKNKGNIAIEQDGEIVIQICKCMEVRRCIREMKKLGINPDYTFEHFKPEEQWQQYILEQAKTYCEEKEGWFFIGGQVGCGKSHICTAILKEFIKAKAACKYMLWVDVGRELKATINDVDKYKKLIKSIQCSEVLYIDDFLKTSDSDRPTLADLKLAYEILNYRYNAKLTTIISSEFILQDILKLNEAVGSRIIERAKFKINIKKDSTKNYRLKNCGFAI